MSPPQFLGTYSATLDAEGRIQLPAALRDELNFRQSDFRLMATLDGDGSVCLRERADWEAWSAALQGARTLRQRDRQTLMTVAAHTSPVKCDKQGRVRVADGLLGLIGLDRSGQAGGRDVVLTGAFREIRVWSLAAWESFSAGALETLAGDLDALLLADDLFQSNVGEET